MRPRAKSLTSTGTPERPPPPQVLQHELLMAAEDRVEYI